MSVTVDAAVEVVVKKRAPMKAPEFGYAMGNAHSADGKLTTDWKHRKVAATYVSQSSCPLDCALLHNGCYTERGPMGVHTARLAAAGPASPKLIALAHAQAIDALPGGTPLRLRVVGDATTDEAAQIEAEAAQRYSDRSFALTGIRPLIWAYTHAWRIVSRSAWGIISILASCETDADVRLAIARGYTPALVRAHEDIMDTIEGLHVVKCPQQTGKAKDCFGCGACGREDKLHANAQLIAFDPHGAMNQINTMLRSRRAAVDA